MMEVPTTPRLLKTLQTTTRLIVKNFKFLVQIDDEELHKMISNNEHSKTDEEKHKRHLEATDNAWVLNRIKNHLQNLYKGSSYSFLDK
jgi:hypothetical protein